jgi:Arm DNA-binding domain
MKLTERKIEKLSTEHRRKDWLVFDDAQRGLAVRVTASGGQTYLCQYTLHGHKWRVPLGSCSAVALSKAREAAAALMIACAPCALGCCCLFTVGCRVAALRHVTRPLSCSNALVCNWHKADMVITLNDVRFWG